MPPSEENKAIVLKAFDTLFNMRDYAKAAEFWSEGYIQHSAHIPPGRDGLFGLVRAMPDTLRYENHLILAEGDDVMLHGRFTGHAGPRPWLAADRLRMKDGLLAEHWDVLADEPTQAESVSGLPAIGATFADPDLAPSPGMSASALTVEEARKITAPLYEALNRPAEKDVSALLAEAALTDYRSHHTNQEYLTRDQLVEVFKNIGAAVPDLKWTVQDIQVRGDQVIVRGRATGTPTGEFWGNKPTGKGFDTMAIDLFTVRNGKLANAYHVENWVGALQQMAAESLAPMPENNSSSAVNAQTQFLEASGETYAYRRFGSGPNLPLLCLQHFTGTLDNWDPAVTDPLAAQREVILFESAGIGRSTGKVPTTVAAMADHALAFINGLGLPRCDVLGFSLGGMVAQEVALRRAALVRRMILVGTAPRGGESIMHINEGRIGKYLSDPTLKGYAVLQKIFFAQSDTSQEAGAAFIERLMLRKDDREPVSSAEVAQAQVAAFRDWERASGERFADLKNIRQPVLVVNGVFDEMIPVQNSYWLSAHLPNAVLMTYPDSGHGSLFQFHESFTSQAIAFLASASAEAPYPP